MNTCKIGDYWYILSKLKPKQGEFYLCIITDSSGVRLSTGERLETNKILDSHKNCIAILGTDHPGLIISGCPNLDGFIIK